MYIFFFNNRTMVHTVQLISIKAVDWGFKLNKILTININHYWSDTSYWWLEMLQLVKVDKWFLGRFQQQSCCFFCLLYFSITHTNRLIHWNQKRKPIFFSFYIYHRDFGQAMIVLSAICRLADPSSFRQYFYNVIDRFDGMRSLYLPKIKL